MFSPRETRPNIAVLGSLDPDRDIDPPLRSIAAAREACRQLGRELARAGCDLIVHSSDPRYAEVHVVEGYVAASDADGPGTVFVHVPRHRDTTFVVPPGSSATLKVVRDTTTQWEVPFYRTLLASDGAVLVGGGQSTRAAGVVAMAQGIPLIPVAAFGGGANLVWVNLGQIRNDTDDEDIALLGADWDAESAARLTACLLRQRERRAVALRLQDHSARKAVRGFALGMGTAVVFLLVALAALVLAGPPAPAAAHGLALLVAAPLLAAMAGAIVRNSFEQDPRWPTAAVRGLGAGVVSVLLYVASQLLTVPTLLDDLDVRRILFFAIPLGFSSGYTFDLVYERLRSEPASSIGPPSQGPR
ncbi:hypothetical protein OHS59_11895 [Streptomyces sp. NBC_00414]|uniref:hypothetical protein n=1 Tax=Streptomyces sp. NBC_00414 TaxID=2975739 RepID=UPI002E20DDBF